MIYIYGYGYTDIVTQSTSQPINQTVDFKGPKLVIDCWDQSTSKSLEVTSLGSLDPNWRLQGVCWLIGPNNQSLVRVP